MPYVGNSPLNYRINTPNTILRRIETRAPINNQDGFKTPLFTQWLDSSSDDLYILVGITNTTTTWVFVGGTPGDLSTLTVDAFTGPGTNPVLANAARSITITGSQVATGTVGANVIRTDSLAANTFTIEIQRTTTSVAADSTVNGVSHFDSAAFTVDADGFVQLVSGGIPAVEFLPDSGTTPVVPNGSGQVTMTGSNGLSFVGGANTLTVTSDNGQLLTEFLVSSGTSPVVADGSGQITLTDGNGVGMTGGLNAITFDMVSPFTGDFTFTDSIVGNTEILTISHSDNTTATSNAQVLTQTAGASGGDPFLTFTVSGVQSWSLGIDNSDSDKFKITEAVDLTSTDRLTWDPSANGDCILLPDGTGRVTVGSGTPTAAGVSDQPTVSGAYSTPGGQVFMSISNNDNTNTASHALLNIEVGGAAGGDPHVTYLGSGTIWTHGMDNSDNDVFKLSQNTNLGTNDYFIMTTAGERTMPLQPAFLATQTLAQNNLPINATTTFTINNEIFDQNADYDNTTYTFTAPITGRYDLRLNVRLNTIDTATTFIIFLITTSNRAYSWQIPLTQDYSADTNPSWSFSTLADMDALDTAVCRIQIANSGASQADVQVDSGSNTWTNFSGALIY